MRLRRIHVVALGLAVGALAVGGGVAIAGNGKGGGSLKGAAQHLAAKAQHAEAFAKELGKTVAQVDAAYESAALARIDAAQKAGEITAAEATSLKTAVDAHPGFARRLALPADVAKALGVTVEKLQAAHLTVHKAQAKARVDQALADGKITKEYAEQLKKQIDAATGPPQGKGFGHRGHGPRGHHGPGMMGPGMMGPGMMGPGMMGPGMMGPGFDKAPKQGTQPAAYRF